MSDEDLWEAARARTREDVRQIFARTPEAPQRTCPHCGEQAQTREEHCPACGRSYFERPDRFSRSHAPDPAERSERWPAAALLALVVVVLVHQARDNGTSAREKRAAAAAAERARLTREQRPHHARRRPARDDRGAAAAVRLGMRNALVDRSKPPSRPTRAGASRATSCAPAASARRAATRWPTTRAATSSTCASRWARYACEAAVETASNAGITSTLGVPFVGTIDFPRGRLTWCKDNPTSASDVKSALAFVRLSRECTAARGPVFGSGYLIEPRRVSRRGLDATGDTRRGWPRPT